MIRPSFSVMLRSLPNDRMKQGGLAALSASARTRSQGSSLTYGRSELGTEGGAFSRTWSGSLDTATRAPSSTIERRSRWSLLWHCWTKSSNESSPDESRSGDSYCSRMIELFRVQWFAGSGSTTVSSVKRWHTRASRPSPRTSLLSRLLLRCYQSSQSLGNDCGLQERRHVGEKQVV